MLLRHLLLVALVHLAAAGTRYGPMRRQQDNETNSSVLAYNISMPVDHFNISDTRKYNNRYWVNDVHYQPGGPVLFHDFGETGINDEFAQEYLSGSVVATACVELAKRFNGLIVGWEHRYYGKSLPVPWIPGNISAFGFGDDGGQPKAGFNGWEYLTVEQALEDVVYFAKNFNLSTHEDQDLIPWSTPWVWLGGSYPGMRGAYIRLRNPEIFYAVWASSAPVQARTDQAVYFNPIYRSMPTNCSSDVHAVMQYVDGILSSSQRTLITNLKKMSAAVQELIGNLNRAPDIEGAANTSAFITGREFMYPIVSGFQDFGPALTIHRFCDWMQSYDPATEPAVSLATPSNISTYALSVFNNSGAGKAEDSGIASRYGVAAALNAYLYASRIYQEYILNISLEDTELMLRPPDFISDQNAWEYQSLTELGFLKGSEPESPMNMISKYLNVTSLRSDLLREYFGPYNPNIFPKKPNTDVVFRYGGWDMRPSNVMFTEGEFDPWRSLGVLSEETTINAPMRSVVPTIPTCGQAPNGTDVLWGHISGCRSCARSLKGPSSRREWNRQSVRSGP